MSYIDSASEVLDRTEASLNSLIVDALKAKAYREVATLAALAEAVAAIGPGRAREGKRMGAAVPEVAVSQTAPPPPEPPKASEPSWMRPKTS